MEKIRQLLGVIIASVAVAVVYYLFETSVHNSINFIWLNIFNTDTTRLLVVPLCISLTLVFFGLQHLLDKKSESHEAHGLGGGKIDTSFKKLGTILLIGFFSLVAGASLGPEAVLVPACIVVGGIIGNRLFKGDKKSIGAMAGASIIALFAAFFHSFFVGLLGIFLITKQAKTKINAEILVVAIIASATSYYTLKLIDPKTQFFNWPVYDWKIKLIDLAIALALVAVGYATTFAIKTSHNVFENIRELTNKYDWWAKALLAGVGLSSLYLMGGPLVQFTGNESIAPMLKQATSLGFVGLSWIFIIKVMAIAWSKSMGYRGGLIFPTIFVANILVAIATLFYKDTNFMLALIGAMAGVILADKKVKILF